MLYFLSELLFDISSLYIISVIPVFFVTFYFTKLNRTSTIRPTNRNIYLNLLIVIVRTVAVANQTLNKENIYQTFGKATNKLLSLDDN